jgi:hypothetical protein
MYQCSIRVVLYNLFKCFQYGYLNRYADIILSIELLDGQEHEVPFIEKNTSPL